MRKQFVLAMSTLVISTALVGCGSKPDHNQNEIHTEVTSSPEAELPTSSEEVIPPVTSVVPEEDATAEVSTVPHESSEPEAKPSPQNTTKPEVTIKPTPTPKPEATAVPTPTPKPEATAVPTPTSKPEATIKPTPTSKPEATVKPTPTSKPEATVKPTPTTSPEVTSLTATEVFNQMIIGVELPSTMDLDAVLLQDMYGIDTTLLKSYKAVAPIMSAHITEIAIFEVNDAKDINAIKAGIEKRTGGMNPQFMYPSLVPIYENRQIIVSGNYIFFGMDASIDTLVANFKSIVK